MAKNPLEVPQTPTDIPAPDVENIESSKLEWGPVFENTSWYDAERKIEKLNKKLKEGERRWRLPRKDELLIVTQSLDRDKRSSAGFIPGNYWSDTNAPDNRRDGAWYVDLYFGITAFCLKNEKKGMYARPVRDAA